MDLTDWQQTLALTISPLEIIARGSLMYWFLFLLFRVVVRRTIGAYAVADMLVVVLIADAAQNGMAGDGKSVADAALLVATIVFWNLLIDWLAFRWQWFERLVQAPPLLLVKDGRVLRHNLRREFITRDDLMEELRIQGIDSLEQVRSAHMEGNGEVSVITRDHYARRVPRGGGQQE